MAVFGRNKNQPAPPAPTLRGPTAKATAPTPDPKGHGPDGLVIEALVTQGLLSTEGPLTDRDVRTMILVALSATDDDVVIDLDSPAGPAQTVITTNESDTQARLFSANG